MLNICKKDGFSKNQGYLAQVQSPQNLGFSCTSRS